MILDTIVQQNRPLLEARKREYSLARLQQMIEQQDSVPMDLAVNFDRDGMAIIAEVKQASPSRGLIRSDFNPVSIAREFATVGVGAISVLTESIYFKGKIEYLADIKMALEGCQIPLLRKDFIYDPYQVYESRAFGADAVLLIVAMLTEEKLLELLKIAHGLGMKCLVETHTAEEMKVALETGAEIIGINNRDLHTFRVDLETTERLAPLVPVGHWIVSESGIREPADIRRMYLAGARAVLIGESLMVAEDISNKIDELKWSK